MSDMQDGPAAKKPPCDVVMKGGITSGVVYPLAICELAKEFQLQNIGGTSAGAVAAAVAAAAEFGRDSKEGGYQVLAEVPDIMSKDLLSLFQPSPETRPLFKMAIAALRDESTPIKLGRAVWAGISNYPLATGLGVLAGLIVPHVALGVGIRLGLGMRVLLPLVGGGSGLSLGLRSTVKKDLPDHGYGMCSGLTQPGNKKPALTDWLADIIDRAAGRDVTGPPLTFGDLEAKEINLQMMTTNLSMRRPYRLPLETGIYVFRRSEFAKLFPKRVLDHLISTNPSYPHDGQQLEDYYYFPEKEQLPVVVAARMSLSFPGLISAVPLYARDFTLKGEQERNKLRKCWFSDGGLSSNFPIHMFDRLFPNSPTFGISLEPFNEQRHGDELVNMPVAARGGILLPINPIKGFGDFVMTAWYTSMEWQDNLQSILPGYRERIVHLALDQDEGGFNLEMPPETISRLSNRGAEAGQLAVKNFGTPAAGQEPEFDLNDHRWRRFLIAMANLDETLADFRLAYGDTDADHELSFRKLLESYVEEQKKPLEDRKIPLSYKPKSKEWLDETKRRSDELFDLAKQWRDREGDGGKLATRAGEIPDPATDLRLVPSDRT